MMLAKHLPNILTLGNLICGCLGILLVQEFPPYIPAYLVWAACVFDFFDGFSARLLKSTSLIGKELDSLADMVSFGVLPSLTMYTWLHQVQPDNPLVYSAFLIAVFSALRLAKFNIDENQKDNFIGLPTPAHALFITGLVFLDEPFDAVTSSFSGLLTITVLGSLLLVIPLPLFALKFKNYSWGENQLRFIFVAMSVLLLAWMQAAGIPFIILLYLVLSLAERIQAKN